MRSRRGRAGDQIGRTDKQILRPSAPPPHKAEHSPWRTDERTNERAIVLRNYRVCVSIISLSLSLWCLNNTHHKIFLSLRHGQWQTSAARVRLDYARTHARKLTASWALACGSARVPHCVRVYLMVLRRLVTCCRVAQLGAYKLSWVVVANQRVKNKNKLRACVLVYIYKRKRLKLNFRAHTRKQFVYLSGQIMSAQSREQTHKLDCSHLFETRVSQRQTQLWLWLWLCVLLSGEKI